MIEARPIATRQIDAIAAGTFIAAALMYQLTDVYGDLGFWFFAKSHRLLGVARDRNSPATAHQMNPKSSPIGLTINRSGG